MANTLVNVMQVERFKTATVTASSSYAAGWTADKTQDDVCSGDGTNIWLTASTTTGWLSWNLGSSQYLDTIILTPGYSVLSSAAKNVTIQTSTNGSTWSDLASFTSIFGASAPTIQQYAILTFTRTSSQYWRANITANYGHATYLSVGEAKAFDSTLLGTSLLDAGGTTVTFANASATSTKTELSNHVFTTYGWYNQTKWSAIEIDFGSAQYVGGFACNQYTATGYWPTAFWVFTSTDGAAWTLQEIVTHGITDTAKNLFASIAFSRIYSTRYLRLEANGLTNGTIVADIWMHATLTPAAPADPTSLLVTGDSDDSTSLQLRWSQAAGDDNPVADLQWNVQRQKNGGGYSTVATVVAPSAGLQEYIDTGLASGSYEYKVRAVGKYHAVASAYTAASTAITIPIAAGGGATGGADLLFVGAGTRGR